MKVFITGATGFIGSHLALKLARRGYTVHALCRSLEKAARLAHKNIVVFKGDILDRESLEKAIKSTQQGYHLAALARAWAKDPQEFFRVNVSGTVNVLDAALKNGVKRVVLTSTAGVLGPSSSEPLDETSLNTRDFFNEYERAKYLMEQRAREYLSRGLGVVVVSPPRVYGPGVLSQSNSVTRMVRAYLRGKWRIIPGSGRKLGNYAYVDDVVEGHLLAMEKGRPGEKYNLGGVDVSYSEFFRTLARVSGKRQVMVKVPVFLMVWASWLMERWAELSGQLPLITPCWVKKYFLYDWQVSSKKAAQELGYTITPLEVGLKKTIAWLRERER